MGIIFTALLIIVVSIFMVVSELRLANKKLEYIMDKLAQEHRMNQKLRGASDGQNNH